MSKAEQSSTAKATEKKAGKNVAVEEKKASEVVTTKPSEKKEIEVPFTPESPEKVDDEGQSPVGCSGRSSSKALPAIRGVPGGQST